MRDATLFRVQWDGLVAQARILATHAPGGQLHEEDGMVSALMPAAPQSSLMNVAMSLDPAAGPANLAALRERYAQAGVAKWGLWVDADLEAGASAAAEHGMELDSTPQGMVAALHAVDHDAEPPPPHRAIGLATVGRVNDEAYGFPEPRLERVIATLPPAVLTYAAPQDGEAASVAMAFDVGSDTAVWFVATTPQSRGQQLATGIVNRVLHDARRRGQRTASLQASAAGAPIYERLGFQQIGALQLYEERLR